MRRLYFPLRSSVEFFDDPTLVQAGARAKEGAVLFDEVLFESGMVIANVGEDASFTIYRPAHELGPEDFADTAKMAEPGGEFVIAVGTENSPGSASTEMQSIIKTKAVERYTAEWHTTAIQDLETLEVDWAKFGGLTDEELQKLAKPIHEVGRHFKEQTSGPPSFHGSWAAEALAHDAVVAKHIGAAINLTSLFEPLIAPKDVGAASGSDALGFLVPNLSSLPWETIAEFRQHPASGEARDKLREIEERAAGQEPTDAADYIRKIGISITEDLMAALAETEVSVGGMLVSEAAKTAISFIPIVGSAVGNVIGAAEALDQWTAQKGNWYFALMKLRAP